MELLVRVVVVIAQPVEYITSVVLPEEVVELKATVAQLQEQLSAKDKSIEVSYLLHNL